MQATITQLNFYICMDQTHLEKPVISFLKMQRVIMPTAGLALGINSKYESSHARFILSVEYMSL